MATKAQIEVPAQTKAPFPPFQGETFASQLLWLAIAFVGLYLIISRLAIPQIGGIMAARQGRIAEDLAAAGKSKEQSDLALATYEKSLADARGRAQSLAAETRAKLNAEAEEARKRLEGELNTKLAQAEQAIAATKTAAMANVRGIATDATAAIVERLIGQVPPAQTVESAVSEVLK